TASLQPRQRTACPCAVTRMHYCPADRKARQYCIRLTQLMFSIKHVPVTCANGPRAPPFLLGSLAVAPSPPRPPHMVLPRCFVGGIRTALGSKIGGPNVSA